MDPDQVLTDIRELSAGIADDRAGLGVVLAEKVEVLDAWLSRGGFLPKAWAGRHDGAMVEWPW